MKNELVPLTPAEESRLAEAETIIEKGLSTFMTVGAELAKIRDEKLYKSEFRTFDDYVRNRWDMSRIHAHRLIAAVDTIKMLPRGNIPESEGVARPLTTIKEPEKVQAAWSSATATASAEGRKVTSKDVKHAVEALLPRSTDNIEDAEFDEVDVAPISEKEEPNPDRFAPQAHTQARPLAVAAISQLKRMEDSDKSLFYAITIVESMSKLLLDRINGQNIHHIRFVQAALDNMYRIDRLHCEGADVRKDLEWIISRCEELSKSRL